MSSKDVKFFSEVVNLFNFLLKGHHSKELDPKLIAKRYEIYKRDHNGIFHNFEFNKSLCFSFFGLVRQWYAKGLNYWLHFFENVCNDTHFYIAFFMVFVSLDIDMTEENNAEFINLIIKYICEWIHLLIEAFTNPKDTSKIENKILILTEWLKNLNDSKKIRNKIESIYTRFPNLKPNLFDLASIVSKAYLIKEKTFKDILLFYIGTIWKSLTRNPDKISDNLKKEFEKNFPDFYNLIKFLFENTDTNKFDHKLFAQRYAICREEQTGKFLIDKSFWLSFISVMKNLMKVGKEPIDWKHLFKSATHTFLHIYIFIMIVLLRIDFTETSNTRFLFELLYEIMQILSEWILNPIDTKKIKNKFESIYDRVKPPKTIQELIDVFMETFFLNEKTFRSTFWINCDSVLATLYRDLDEAVELLLEFDQVNLEQIKTGKQKLQRIEDSYDHVETFPALVEEYGKIVKQIEHKTSLYTTLNEENEKINMLSSINDDVDNFRLKKINLNAGINSTLRELKKTKEMLMEHRFLMRTVTILPFVTILLGTSLNGLSYYEKKKKRIDDQFVASLTERSSNVIESVIKDLDDIIEQKSKVLDKIELVEKINADYKGWHQLEKDCLLKLM